jgi:hypothetical protein
MMILNAIRQAAAAAGLLAMTISIAQADGLVDDAQALLDALSAEQQNAVIHPFEDDDRFDWHFIPKASRKGLPIRDMNAAQVTLTHDLLKTVLSAAGYKKTDKIMWLEGVLGDIEGRPDHRDPQKYYVSVFGEPKAGGNWALSFEGHHVSLNFTIVDGAVVASSPAFFAANPHRILQGPHKGTRVLADEEDRARELLMALDDKQRTQAIIATVAPGDILTGARPQISPLKPAGLPASAMSADQRALLRALIDTYADNVAGDAATERQAQIEAAGDDIRFAWMGSPKVGKPHYYRVQTATFLIEYDNIQNGANHSHTVWRDFDGDFGRDVIAEHRAAHKH